jgi:hypothetical protein
MSLSWKSCVLVAGVAIAAAFLVLLTPSPEAARADVSQPLVTNGNPTAAAGARTIYSVAFNTSANGGLSGGDQITITFPSGTDITHLSSSAVKNSSGTTVGFCNTLRLRTRIRSPRRHIQW